jgi:molybdenum cofactor cytidylyltransferase
MGKAVSALVLAAGESTRMGTTKQLMKLGQKTILEQTVDNILNSEVSEVIVVLGHKADKAAKLLKDRPVIVAVNKNYQQGISTSITAGLKFIKPDAEGILFALADQPFVDPDTLNQLIKEFLKNNKGIIIPVFQERRGNPTIFSKKYKREFLSIHGDVGGREIISRHPEDILEVRVQCPGVLADLDTVEDYQREVNNNLASSNI